MDPLDGTTNFLHGFPHYAVSIAYALKGRVMAAAVYDPVKDELFSAERSRGAFLNNARIRVSGRTDMQGTDRHRFSLPPQRRLRNVPTQARACRPLLRGAAPRRLSRA